MHQNPSVENILYECLYWTIVLRLRSRVFQNHFLIPVLEITVALFVEGDNSTFTVHLGYEMNKIREKTKWKYMIFIQEKENSYLHGFSPVFISFALKIDSKSWFISTTNTVKNLLTR